MKSGALKRTLLKVSIPSSPKGKRKQWERIVTAQFTNHFPKWLATELNRLRTESYADYCQREGLIIAAKEALSSIVEWRKAELIEGTEPLEFQLRNAIAEAEGE